MVHSGPQLVASAHFTPPGHVPCVPGVQAPEPLQAPAGVSIPALHTGEPHDMLTPG
jgi:hypothetical protein